MKCQPFVFSKILSVFFSAIFVSGLLFSSSYSASQTLKSKSTRTSQDPKSTSNKVVFVKKKIKIWSKSSSSKIITVEVADTAARLEQGLMNRTHLANDTGMLFVFDYQRVLRFWMKNTLIPLSIGFFDRDKKLFDVQEMQPESVLQREPQIYQSKKAAMYALEMPKGWFEKNKILADQSQFEFVTKP